MFYSVDIICEWRKKNRWMFLNLPISQKLSVTPAVWLLLRRDKFEFFFGMQVCHSWKNPSVNIFLIMLTVFYPFVASTSNSSVLNPKQSLINLNLINWHHLRHIHPWNGFYYGLLWLCFIPSIIKKKCPAATINLK